MRRFIPLYLTILFSLLIPHFSPLSAAGPKWMKQASKSLATLYAIQQRGDTIQANGFFTNETGQLVAPFKAIHQARSAWVVDASGYRFEVSRIQGFNSTYNVVRLQAESGKKKTVCLPIASTSPTKGQSVYAIPTATPDPVAQVEKAGEYGYYTLTSQATPDLAGNPVVNEAGEVVAILQTPVLAAKAPNYALDIRLPLSLTIRPIDANNADLRQCAIPKQLPADEAQATSFLYIANATAGTREAYIEDFIRAFPQSATGYIQKAETQVAAQSYEAARQTYDEALRQRTGHDDEVLYSRSRAIYNTVLQGTNTLPEQWTLEQALSDIQTASQANPLPLYALHEANTLFALKRYDEAYQRYIALTQTPMRSPEVFMYAWQCQQNLGAEKETLLALNDSAVACFTKPYTTEAAPFLYLRSTTLQEMGRVREAILDLNDYEHLMQGQLTDQFYYQREQLESRVRMYGPAVNDIQKAISLSPDEPIYHAESAVLFFRLNDLDAAIAACRKAISLDDDFPDAHRLLGICMREKGDLASARRHLQRAIDLGDPMASGILEKLGK